MTTVLINIQLNLVQLYPDTRVPQVQYPGNVIINILLEYLRYIIAVYMYA